jgi:hypothetical protein
MADHAFDKHGGIDPSHSVMRLFHVAQDARFRLAGVGIDRDHLAARVTLEDGEVQPLPDLEAPPDQIAKPALVPRRATDGVSLGLRQLASPNERCSVERSAPNSKVMRFLRFLP